MGQIRALKDKVERVDDLEQRTCCGCKSRIVVLGVDK